MRLVFDSSRHFPQAGVQRAERVYGGAVCREADRAYAREQGRDEHS